MGIDPKDTTVYFTEPEIQRLINENKIISKRKKLTNVQSLYGILKGSKVGMVGEDGHKFELRASVTEEDDFSIILTVTIEEINTEFHLLRYDGIDTHKNKLENEQLGFNFHIHHATERYQEKKYREHDGYAEITDKYENFYEALTVVVEDCNITFADQDKSQEEIFE